MIKRFLLKLIAPELNQLKEDLAEVEGALEDLCVTVSSHTQKLDSHEFDYEQLACELNYSHLFDELDYSVLSSYLSYSDLAEEIDTDLIEFDTDQMRDVAEHLDIDALGDHLVGHPDLTERVGFYLSKKSLRFN